MSSVWPHSRWARKLAVAASIYATACVIPAQASTTAPWAATVAAGANTAPPATSSSPPDRTVYVLPATATPITRRATLIPAASGVFTADPSLSANSGGGGEPSIAIDPADPTKIAITRFTFPWNGNADFLYSADGGITWTEEATIPVPPGIGGTSGCPCDQNLDYGRDGRLYGTFLTFSPTTVVTGSTTDPTKAASWLWNGNPAQLTTGTRTNVDQPWLLVNRDPTTAGQDDVYVAYDDFGGSPDARVAVSYGASPVNITADNKAGTESPNATNPGLRLAIDPRNGTVYALYEQSSGATQPKSVTYKLNRSTDGGATWTLNGSTDGLTVDSVKSDQAPGFKFGGVNALLGGVDHAAVDPTNGDVYVVYGQDVSGGNQIKIRRLQDNGAGGLNVGAATNVSTSTNAALPSIAVLTDGTIGVLYDTFDGTDSNGFPLFSAHLARSTDHGATFNDVVLEAFASPAKDNGNARQRVLGDFQQMKAVGAAFYGVFSGNRNGFNSPTSTIDPIFFSVPQRTEISLTSSVNPSVFGQPVDFTATVNPVPDAGSVTFKVDGSAFGSPATVNTATGIATLSAVSSLSAGVHSVVAIYSGAPNFASSTSAMLTQVVIKDPTTTTLTSSVNPSHFGQPVTFTADVTANPPGSGTPSGTVTFTADGSQIGLPATLAGGHASSIAVSSLAPGVHLIAAGYSGDSNFLPSSATLTQVVGCTVNLTGKVKGGLQVTSSTCLNGATVDGHVSVLPGGALSVVNSRLNGGLSAQGATGIRVCGSRIDGRVSISRSTCFVELGDAGDDGAPACAGDDFRGGVVLSGNTAGAEIGRDTIRGGLTLVGNTGGGATIEDAAPEIEGNHVNGSLVCTGNMPAPIDNGIPNSVTGARSGQCSSPSF